jgi:signal peptidase I
MIIARLLNLGKYGNIAMWISTDIMSIIRQTLSFIWEVAKIAIIALLIVAPIRFFLFQPFLVKGQSMEPNFYNSDYLIVDELSYRFREPLRGEVVVFKYPQDVSQRYIKRIIGLPNETIKIQDGKVFILQENKQYILDETNYFPDSIQTLGNITISLQEDEYFVLGDNRQFSSDSRRWGAVADEEIVGRAFLRLWPFSALSKIETPSYQ